MPSEVRIRAIRLISAGVILALAFALGACGGDDEEVVGRGGGSADITITKHNRFEPKELNIQENREVTLTVSNEDDEVHNFSLSFLDIDKDIPPGQRVDVKIPAGVAPRDGFYVVRCKYHQALGEFGELKVVS